MQNLFQPLTVADEAAQSFQDRIILDQVINHAQRDPPASTRNDKDAIKTFC